MYFAKTDTPFWHYADPGHITIDSAIHDYGSYDVNIVIKLASQTISEWTAPFDTKIAIMVCFLMLRFVDYN